VCMPSPAGASCMQGSGDAAFLLCMLGAVCCRSVLHYEPAYGDHLTQLDLCRAVGCADTAQLHGAAHPAALLTLHSSASSSMWSGLMQAEPC
jgi:hypothetical protein